MSNDTRRRTTSTLDHPIWGGAGLFRFGAWQIFGTGFLFHFRGISLPGSALWTHLLFLGVVESNIMCIGGV